jgi:uncharacterized spore protein YtfJ
METTAATTINGPRRDLLGTLAEQVGSRLTASTVYGSPVEREGVTVIPVATVRFALGGGGAGGSTAQGEGEGGGTLGSGHPSGYIELRDGRSRFVPIVHPERLALIGSVGVLGMAVLALGWRTMPRFGHVGPLRLRRMR